MSVKISSLEIENVKRIKAVQLTPGENGLTVIGGNNGQGKTSVLDAIAWALGGSKYEPSAAKRDGSTVPPHLTVRLSNGIIVERKGKNSDLKVIDPSGNKSGQALLNSFISQFALDLPKFMNANNKEKADILLRIIGVGDRLYQLENEEERKYNERLTVGRITDQKQKYADEMPSFPDVPDELVSASDLILRQQEIEGKANDLQEQITRLNHELTVVLAQLESARKTVSELHDESTAEIERSIAEIEEINRKVRANLDKEKAAEDAKHFSDQYSALTAEIEQLRQAKRDLLNHADLPLEGLSVQNGALVSEQLRVATAIVRKLNPSCGFVLIDKLEQMDADTLREFGEWLESEGLQAIATRVSKGDECCVVIEDGYSVPMVHTTKKDWKAGEF